MGQKYKLWWMAIGGWGRDNLGPTAWNCHLHPSLGFSGSSNHYDPRIFGTLLTGESVSSKSIALGYATQRTTHVFASVVNAAHCNESTGYLLRRCRHLASIKVRYTSHRLYSFRQLAVRMVVSVTAVFRLVDNMLSSSLHNIVHWPNYKLDSLANSTRDTGKRATGNVFHIFQDVFLCTCWLSCYFSLLWNY